MSGDVYRLAEIGQSDVQSLINRVVVVVEESEIVAKITGDEDEPHAEKRRRYDPALHAASIGTKFQ